MAIIEMGDFAGAVFKYLKRYPIDRLTLVGGMGKFSKLATGRLDLHSRKGGVDFDFLADLVKDADAGTRQAVRDANTSLAAYAVAGEAGIDLAARVAAQAWRWAAAHLPSDIAMELWVTDKPGHLLARHGTLDCSLADCAE